MRKNNKLAGFIFPHHATENLLPCRRKSAVQQKSVRRAADSNLPCSKKTSAVQQIFGSRTADFQVPLSPENFRRNFCKTHPYDGAKSVSS